MSKSSSVYVCQQCGTESAKWMGRCPACGEWNSFAETERFNRAGESKSKRARVKVKQTTVLKDIRLKDLDRVKTGIKELDNALGGGLVLGQVILLAGEPGIGKSTILLQLGKNLSSFYASGEESLSQIKIRAERLGITGTKTICLTETDIDIVLSSIDATIKKSKVQAVFIDSVQTMYTEDLSGPPGSVGQVREVALRLIRFAKQTGVVVILVGHVTKEGSVAGPATLMHMVDTVLWFEGEREHSMRILRVLKNRFGATDEIAIFRMEDKGLIGVDDTDAIFFEKERGKEASGSVATSVIEGSRSILTEVQSLVVDSKLTIPRRVVQGLEQKRVELILAVLIKHLNLGKLATSDIFVNVIGGMRVRDPGVDLAVAVSIISSLKNYPLKSDLAAIGELGLLGDIRQTASHRKCLKHLQKHGFRVVGPGDKNIIKIFSTIFFRTK